MEQPNSEYINQLSGDNEKFKARIIGILKRELPEEVEVYHQHIKTENYKLAAESVHKLKHKVSILGLEKSYYIAEEYEDNLKENSTCLQSDFEDILERMQDFVDKL
ncbi:MAG: Hpt domain-containing protein [Flavobacterium sp.]|jgi:HPt (histidine-containing phosphotransfer) domain-containing protein|uniref:Hpt domain-containing protein n=1 Tax=Flavobacterium sp. TaxID=239 RepID=UPI0022BB14D8|nr:Hpt domain-containing protein [Flavobacterium sp.]MCZ8089606.1 Hpt domain-containing protein [Flavobacterium sp.]MCZ8330097.1 Hpt domain-containing protein [Flavobacterium sp.]